MTTTQAPADLTTAQTKALAALTEHPGATAKEIAEYAGIGGSTAGKALAVLEDRNLAHREPGGNVGGLGGRRAADHWHPVTPDTGAEDLAAEPEAPEPAPDTADAPAAEAPAAKARPAAAPARRLARGGLRQMVYEHLDAHPGQEFTAPRLAKTLGRSAGAVANALVKLTDQGQADLVGESPRAYRLAGQA
ncbi:helix-turn-helix domain-containing protein [Streptomyces lasiicapitis]|uniref:MarR family transcriptional regulator n=1 Tax=Streptomyces lasiicapitis TaxID=1923961 RepID=UPI0033216586